MKKENIKTFYYSDELHDDFAGVSRNKKEISDNYKYINGNILWRALAFIAYRIIMTPIAYLYCKIKFGLKIVNREKLKGQKGYYLYANHTQMPGDGYIPTLCAFPVKPYVVVHPDSVALPGTEQFMLMIGALPLPSTMHGTANFTAAMDKRIASGNCIMIYPEAHIWPYYTGIRPFGSVSFKYPAKSNRPAYCFTTVYEKRKRRKIPKITVYIDGPFLPDESLSVKQRTQKLRDDVYTAMCSRASLSNYEYCRYIKVSNDEKQQRDKKEEA